MLFILRWYVDLWNVWIRRKVRTNRHVQLWVMWQFAVLWDERNFLDMMNSEVFLGSPEGKTSHVKILMFLAFFRVPAWFLILFFAFFWPFFMLFVTLARYGASFYPNWVSLTERPDLMLGVSLGPFSAKERRSLLSCLPTVLWDGFFFSRISREAYSFALKDVFYEKCLVHSIPTVRILSGRSEGTPGEEYFIKPIGGLQGRGVTTAKDLRDVDFSKFVVQPILKNHPEIVRICGPTAALSTFRCMTFKSRTSSPVVLGGFLRLARADSIVDNFHRGGIAVPISSSGILRRGTTDLLKRSNWNDRYALDSHVDTEVKFEGHRLIFYEEACALAIKGHAHLAQDCILIGWDVALTPSGPILLEGNPMAGSLEFLDFQHFDTVMNEVIERIGIYWK